MTPDTDHNDRCASLLGQGCDCRSPWADEEPTSAARLVASCAPCGGKGTAPDGSRCWACDGTGDEDGYDRDCSVSQVGDREWWCNRHRRDAEDCWAVGLTTLPVCPLSGCTCMDDSEADRA